MSVYNVATAAQLTTALSKVVGGDTIRLASGNYGAVDIRNFRPGDLVTIESANAAAPAHLDSLYVQHAQNLAFRGLDVGRALTANDFEFTRMIEVRDATRMIFDDLDVHGSLDGQVNDGYGMFASNVAGMVVTNTTFTENTNGLTFQQSDNLQITNNSFLEMRVNGLTMAAVSKVVIDGNLFKGFHPLSYDHPDAIQFFNVQQPRGTSDVTIRNNVLLPGGDGPQGIWISDAAHPYTNIVIENNLLWSTGQYNGIGVTGARGVQILNNTILSAGNDARQFWINLHGNSDILVSGNVSDNFLLQNQPINLVEVNNTFFHRDPGARALFRNLDNPTSVDDLIIPDRGYQKPVLHEAAPVAGAIGGGLANMIGQVNGSVVSKTAIDETPAFAGDTISLAGLSATTSAASLFGLGIKDTLVAALPVIGAFEWGTEQAVFAATQPQPSYSPGVRLDMMAFDHFVALP